MKESNIDSAAMALISRIALIKGNPGAAKSIPKDDLLPGDGAAPLHDRQAAGGPSRGVPARDHSRHLPPAGGRSEAWARSGHLHRPGPHDTRAAGMVGLEMERAEEVH